MNKKIIRYIVSIVIIIVIISIIGIVYSNSTKTTEKDVYEKIGEEISYIDNKLIELLKALNNLDTEYMLVNNVTKNNENTTVNITTKESGSVFLRDREDVNWDYIQTEVEKIINSWAIATIDLKNINVGNDIILEFNTNVDACLSYLKVHDKANSLISMANLYSLIPRYKSEYSDDVQEVELAYIKSNVLSSYALLYTQQWDKIYALLADSDNRMNNLINSNDININNIQNVQKAYILLKEYIKSANNKDLDLCYMKFYYLIQELEV